MSFYTRLLACFYIYCIVLLLCLLSFSVPHVSNENLFIYLFQFIFTLTSKQDSVHISTAQCKKGQEALNGH